MKRRFNSPPKKEGHPLRSIVVLLGSATGLLEIRKLDKLDI